MPIPKYIFSALRYQLPPYRSLKAAFRNFFVTGNARGMFSINSHINQRTGLEKVSYGSFQSAERAAKKMGKKHGVHFSVYKCAYCKGFHIGRNRDNKQPHTPGEAQG